MQEIKERKRGSVSVSESESEREVCYMSRLVQVAAEICM